MDKIKKALKRLSGREREVVKRLLAMLGAGDTKGLNIKKLKGCEDIFRVRKGNIRVIYRSGKDGSIFILRIDRRKEDIYKF